MWRKKCVRHHPLKPATAAVTPGLSPSFLQNHELRACLEEQIRFTDQAHVSRRWMWTPGRGGGCGRPGQAAHVLSGRLGLQRGGRGLGARTSRLPRGDCAPVAGPPGREDGFPEDSARRLHPTSPWPVRGLQAAPRRPASRVGPFPGAEGFPVPPLLPWVSLAPGCRAGPPPAAARTLARPPAGAQLRGPWGRAAEPRPTRSPRSSWF